MKRKPVSYQPLGIAFGLTLVLILFFNFLPETQKFSQFLLSVKKWFTKTTPYEPNSPLITAVRDAVRFKQLEDENNALRALLKFYERVSLPHVETNVISTDPLNQTLMYVDKGSKNGIRPGQAVIVSEGLLVGTIIRSTETRALVALITNDASRIAATSLDSSETKGVVRGYLDAALRMEYLREKSSVAAGDTVTTSGLEGSLPPGLVIGVIRQISDTDNTLFFNAAVEPIVDFNKLAVVSVIIAP